MERGSVEQILAEIDGELTKVASQRSAPATAPSPVPQDEVNALIQKLAAAADEPEEPEMPPPTVAKVPPQPVAPDMTVKQAANIMAIQSLSFMPELESLASFVKSAADKGFDAGQAFEFFVEQKQREASNGG